MKKGSRFTISRIADLKWFFFLAVLFTALNCVKPICIDDTLYYQNARHMAAGPLRPYGFRVFQNDLPEPAVRALAPPLFPYYWAEAIRLFGENEVAWKLWLLPLSLLLVLALRSLFRRFAAGYELLLTYFVVLSPVFLPSFNLMLEVPVAALSLSALVLFFKAADRSSFALAAISGLIAGMAMQTKYSAFVTPGVMLLYAVLFGKLRFGIVAAAVAATFFGSFEMFIVSATGHSHWLVQSQIFQSVNLLKKYEYLAWPLVTLTGSLGAMLGVMGLVILGAGRRLILGASAFVALGFILITVLPEVLFGRILFANVVFSIFGIGVAVVVVMLVRRSLNATMQPVKELLASLAERKTEAFLVLWLVVEIASYFALSPIPAVRRMTLLLIVTTLIVGRLASQTNVDASRLALMRFVTAGNILLALLFYGVDTHDAFVEKISVARVSAAMDRIDPSAVRWYTGRWGFQFYAEHAGMKPVYPDESQLNVGDLVAITDGQAWSKAWEIHLRRYDLERVEQVNYEDGLPLQTMIGFYDTGIPIHHHEGAQRRVMIYRVRGSASSPGTESLQPTSDVFIK